MLVCRYAPKEALAQPSVPRGVVTRALQNNCRIYLNTTGDPVEIELGWAGNGLLNGKAYAQRLSLAPYDVEILNFQQEGDCFE